MSDPINPPTEIPPAPMASPVNVAPRVVHGYGSAEAAQARAIEFVDAPVHSYDQATDKWVQRPPTEAERTARSQQALKATGFDGLTKPAAIDPATQRIIDREIMVGHDRNATPQSVYDIEMNGNVPAEVRERLGGRLSKAMGSLQLSKDVGRFVGEDIVRAASATVGMDELAQVKWQAQQGEAAVRFLAKHNIEYHAAQKAVDGMLESARVEASVALFARTSFAAFIKLAMLARDRGLIK